jgi:hypothetical protein
MSWAGTAKKDGRDKSRGYLKDFISLVRLWSWLMYGQLAEDFSASLLL